jgi:hypothetical protein
MKHFLLFKTNGEIEKRNTKYKTFSESSTEFILDTDLKFTNYVKYESYIILHNNLYKELNKTVFYFTTDRFNGDVALIKIGENNMVKNLIIDEYFKKLTKKLNETYQKNNVSKSNSDYDYDSDSDVDLSMYGKILIKEPFEY